MVDVIGVVVEYNPFHNGHLYHLTKAREEVPGAHLIGVMSGNWTQRGEPALINKWARAEAALQSGVDIIFELPVVYAVQSAEGFARGAVKTLEATGIVNYLCFGSEAGQLEPLQTIASYMEAEPPLFKKELQLSLKKGLSYPAALHRALSTVSRTGKGLPFSAEVLENFFTPNNILAIEYLKAVKKISPEMVPLTIKRRGAGFHDLQASGDIASATGIRRALFKKELGLVNKTVPGASREILYKEIAAGKGPVHEEKYADVILSLLRRSSPEKLATLPEVIEGMESRLKKASSSPDLHTLIKELKTRRYTRTRLQRILIYLLLSLNKETLSYFNEAGPHYLRILGFSSRGKELLHRIKTHAFLPLVTRPAPFIKDPLISPGAKQMMHYDILATDLYVLGYPNPDQRAGGEDFRHPVVKSDPAVSMQE